MKRRDLRQIWSTNAPHSNSGYGAEMRDVLFRLKKDNWPLFVSSFFGVQGAPIDIDYRPYDEVNLNPKYYGTKIRHYPAMGDPFGGDALVAHGMKVKADVHLTMQDTWVLNPQFLQQIKYWIPWTPIDKDPVPQNVLGNLRYAYKIVSMSRFGQKALEKAGFTSTLILEGVDTEIYKPLDKQAVRKELGLPADAFIFGVIGANKENPPRKGYQESIEAFKIFSDKHPDAFIFINNQQVAPGNYPIKEHIHDLGLDAKAFYVADYKMIYDSNPEDINKQYNAFDVLLHPSQTEGFGLCIVESQSAGTPVLINNIHSMPELIKDGETGYWCKPGKPRYTNDLSYVIPADVDSLAYNMEKIYKDVKSDEEKVSKACRDHIVKNYNIETTAKQWIDLLEKLQTELLPLPVPSLQPSETTVISK